jgi:NADH dehydrogenase
VGDVAACFVGSLTEPGAVGQTYDLCGPERLSFVEVLDVILDVTGRKRLKLRVPMGVARVQATFLELLFPKLLRRAPPLNRDQLIMLGEDNVGDSGPLNSLFGLKPVTFREGIAAWLRRQSRRP